MKKLIYFLLFLPLLIFGQGTEIFNQSKSSADYYTKVLTNRGQVSGAVTVDRSVAIDRIRNSSIGLKKDILKIDNENNLLQFRNDFTNSVWTKNLVAITPNATTDPFGGNTASKITINSNVVNAQFFMYQTIASTNGVYTVTQYAKKAELNYLQVRVDNGIGSTGFFVDLTTAAITQGYHDGTVLTTFPTTYSASIDSNGWVKINFTYTASPGSSLLFYSPCLTNTTTSMTGQLGKGIYIYNNQFEQGSVATPYYGASYVYNPSTYGEGKAYSVYPKLNNLLLWSEDFSNAAWIWTRSGVIITLTPNYASNPFGTNTSTKVSEGTSSDHRFGQSITAVKDNTYTYSAYVRKPTTDPNERRYFWLQLINGSDGQSRYSVIWDLQTETVTYTKNSNVAAPLLTNLNNTITNINGYLRLTITATANYSGSFYGYNSSSNTSTASNADGSPVYVGNTANYNVVYGAQLEQGTTATPYQKTTSIQLDSDLAFTRATPATVTNKDGNIGDSCYNLLQFSEDYSNAYWIKTNVSITTGATTAPTGTLTANKLIANTTNTSTHVVTSSALAIKNNYFTYSIYLKSAEYTNAVVQMTDNVNDSVGANIDLTNGAISGFNPNGQTGTGNIFNSGTVSITQLSNGWYKVVLSAFRTNSGTSNTLVNVYVSNGVGSYAGNNVNGIYIWGAQLTQGSTPRDYLKTTNRLNVPKISYDLDLTKPSLVIEKSSTNLILNSTTGTTQNITVTAQPYTLSLYGTGSYTLSGVGSGTLNGTGTSNRVSLTFTPTAGTLTLTVSGSTTNVQLEAGSNATSWISTEGTSVTRNSETSFVDLTNNSLLNANNFTLYCEGYLYNGATTDGMIYLGNSTTTAASNDSIGVYNQITPQFYTSSTYTNSGLNMGSSGYYKFAIQRSGTTVKFFRNGSLIWTQTVPVFDYRYLAINNGGSSYGVDKIELYKETLSDAQLISKTTL